eukprot:XP_025001436.1 synaptotagmin-3-like [Gallus gallus]
MGDGIPMACRAGYGARCGVRCRAMSGDYEDDVCRRALQLVQELCGHRQHHRQCLDFSDLLRHRGHPRHGDSDISVSLLSVIVTFCGVVLLGVSLFVSWKLCWVPWRHKGGGGRRYPPKRPPPTLRGTPKGRSGPGSDPRKILYGYGAGR